MKQTMLVFSTLKVKGFLQPRNITLLSSYDVKVRKDLAYFGTVPEDMRDSFSRRRPKVPGLAPLTGRFVGLDEVSDHGIMG